MSQFFLDIHSFIPAPAFNRGHCSFLPFFLFLFCFVFIFWSYDRSNNNNKPSLRKIIILHIFLVSFFVFSFLLILVFSILIFWNSVEKNNKFSSIFYSHAFLLSLHRISLYVSFRYCSHKEWKARGCSLSCLAQRVEQEFQLGRDSRQRWFRREGRIKWRIRTRWRSRCTGWWRWRTRWMPF